MRFNVSRFCVCIHALHVRVFKSRPLSAPSPIAQFTTPPSFLWHSLFHVAQSCMEGWLLDQAATSAALGNIPRGAHNPNPGVHRPSVEPTGVGPFATSLRRYVLRCFGGEPAALATSLGWGQPVSGALMRGAPSTVRLMMAGKVSGAGGRL